MNIRASFPQHPAFPLLAIGAAVVTGTVIGAAAILLSSPLLLVAGIFGLLGIAAITIQLRLGLVLLAFITYTRFSDVLVNYHNAPSVAKLLVPYLFGVIIVRWVLFNERPRGWERAVALIGFYIFVAFISLLFAANKTATGEAFGDLIKDALIAITVVLLLYRGRRLKAVIWTLIMAGIFMGTISTYQFVTGAYTNDFAGFGQAQIQNIIGQTNDYRVSGPVGDANFYAQVIVTLIPLALERLWNGRNLLLRLVAGYALVVCGITLIATFSRGGFVALLIMLVAYLVIHPPRLSHLLIGVAMVVLIFQFAPPEYVDRLSTLLDFLPGNETALSEISLRGRTSENTVAWQMFYDHPFLGVGLNNYPDYYLSYARPLGLETRLEARAAHSMYLQVASEQGLIGLVALGALLWGAFAGIGRANRLFKRIGRHDLRGMAMACAVALIGYLVAALFLHNAYPRYLWLLVGIAFAIPEVAQYEAAAKAESEASHE